MPTYDYKCDDCGHAFEEFQYFSEALLKVCPKCHKETLRRLFGSGAAVLFKGSGFYETDYRSNSYKEAAKKDSDSGKGTTDTAATNGTATPSPAPSTPSSTAKSDKSTT